MKNLNLFEREIWNDLAHGRKVLFHKIKKELPETNELAEESILLAFYKVYSLFEVSTIYLI